MLLQQLKRWSLNFGSVLVGVRLMSTSSTKDSPPKVIVHVMPPKTSYSWWHDVPTPASVRAVAGATET